jgi:hypothetical protein
MPCFDVVEHVVMVYCFVVAQSHKKEFDDLNNSMAMAMVFSLCCYVQRHHYHNSSCFHRLLLPKNGVW